MQSVSLSQLSRVQLVAFNRRIYAPIIGTGQELLEAARKSIDLFQSNSTAPVIAISVTTKAISLVKCNWQKEVSHLQLHEFSLPILAQAYSPMEFAAVGWEISRFLLALEPKECVFVYSKRLLHYRWAILAELLQAHCISALGKENQPLYIHALSNRRTEALQLASEGDEREKMHSLSLSKYQKQRALATNAELWARSVAKITNEQHSACLGEHLDAFTNCLLPLDAYFSALHAIHNQPK